MPKLKKAGERGISLGLRFSLFLAVLVSTIILVVAAVLLISGTFTAGLRQSEDAVKSELTLAARNIAEQYGHIAWQAISLARNLSQSISEKADSINLSTSSLDEHPELLEEIIGGEYDKLLFALQVAKSSGAFFILEATVNPSHAMPSIPGPDYILRTWSRMLSARQLPISPSCAALPPSPAGAPTPFMPSGGWNSM